MTRRRLDDVLDGALEELEQLADGAQRLERVGTALGAIAKRRRERPDGLGGSPIELVEVRPGVYQSAPRNRVREALEDLRAVRTALRPEIPDAVVQPTRRRR